MIRFLFPSFRKERYGFLKPNESWTSVVLVDPVVIPIVLILRRYKDRFPFYMVTPNAVTLFSFIIFFLTVVLMFLYPQRIQLLAWAFIVTNLLDEIDGRLARATGRASAFGAMVDSFFDMLRCSLGLALIGLALGRAHHHLWIFPLMTFYCLFHGAFHMNSLTRTVLGRKENKTEDTAKSSWQRFCDRRGLIYSLFSEYEASTLIYLSIIFFKDPLFPITGIILFRLLYWPLAAMSSSGSVSKRLQDG